MCARLSKGAGLEILRRLIQVLLAEEEKSLFKALPRGKKLQKPKKCF
jgi:hypothetical protein